MSTIRYRAIIPMMNLELDEERSNTRFKKLLDNFEIPCYRYITEDEVEEEIKDICINVKYLTEEQLEEYYMFDGEDHRKYVRSMEYPQSANDIILDTICPYLIIKYTIEQKEL